MCKSLHSVTSTAEHCFYTQHFNHIRCGKWDRNHLQTSRCTSYDCAQKVHQEGRWPSMKGGNGAKIFIYTCSKTKSKHQLGFCKYFIECNISIYQSWSITTLMLHCCYHIITRILLIYARLFETETCIKEASGWGGCCQADPARSSLLTNTVTTCVKTEPFLWSLMKSSRHPRNVNFVGYSSAPCETFQERSFSLLFLKYTGYLWRSFTLSFTRFPITAREF